MRTPERAVHLGWLALVVCVGATCGPAAAPPRPGSVPRRPAARAAPKTGYPGLVRQARQHASAREFGAAFALLHGCLDAPVSDRSAGRERCLVVAMRLVDRAYAYYRGRVSYLEDLVSFGRYPKGVDSHGNDKTFILRRARRRARAIGDADELAALDRLRGGGLSAEAGRRLTSTRAAVRAMALHQAVDPDRGPVRTYRYAHGLLRLYPGSAHVPEARFRRLTERRELRLAKGSKLSPYYALKLRLDLEAYLHRYKKGRFALRARWELAPIYFDLWLMSRPAFQRTQDYRDYLKVGGEPVTAAVGERYRKAALTLYRACFAGLPDVVSTYRPGSEPQYDVRQARDQLRSLKQPRPPANRLPATFFPPG